MTKRPKKQMKPKDGASMRSAREQVTCDPRWAAVAGRDPQADGSFFYSVATTGIYCRPSCPSRRPLPENVRFFETRALAEAAGFRPCLRCKSDQPPLQERQASLVARMCRHMERHLGKPSMQELAEVAGVSKSHLHRVFKKVLGVTPMEYARGVRAESARDLLSRGSSVTGAIAAAGHSSSSRFYESSNARLGMTPTQFRRKGEGREIMFALGECSLGSILVAATRKGICEISLGDDPAELLEALQRRFEDAEFLGGDRDFERCVAQVVGLVENPSAAHDLPLDVQGTAFQQKVWMALRRIPPGVTVDYTRVGEMIGAPTASRAVARACGSNNLAVAIPCHRVVRRDGSLAGYRWGIERKEELIAREKRECADHAERNKK